MEEVMTDEEEAILASALKGFPNALGDPVRALILRVMQITYHTHERNEALSLNASQASMIAHLTAENERLRESLEYMSKSNMTNPSDFKQVALAALQRKAGE